MGFNLSAAIHERVSGAVDLGMQQTQKALGDLNLLLGLLQRAGYDVGQVEVELGVPPKISVHLKLSGPISEEKLKAILKEHNDKTMVTTLVNLLLRANQLRGSIKIENIGLAEIRITTSPQMVMSWKELAATA